MKSIITFIFTIMILGCGTTNASDSLYMTFLPKDSIELGCGCLCEFEGTGHGLDSAIAASELGSNEMLFGISGKVVRLKQISFDWTKKKKKGEINLGDEFIEKYEAKDIKIELRYKVTFVCPPDTEGGCEVTRYKGKLILNVKNTTREYKVQGECGC